MNRIGPFNALYPMPTTLVGTMVNGKPNFLAVAHVGILTHHHLSVGLGKIHYSNQGIIENETFSICLPTQNQMVETDYCGIMTGKKTDKAALFDVFYGDLKTAPMIREFLINMELRLHEVLDYQTHDIFIGEIVQTYTDDKVMRDGLVDIAKLKPLLFDMASKKYWSLGPAIGECWREGKALKKAPVENKNKEQVMDDQTKKATIKVRLEKELEILQTKIDEAKIQMNLGMKDAEDKINPHVEKFETELTHARAKLAELGKSSEGAWTEVRDGLESSLDIMKKAFASAEKHFTKDK